MAQNISGSNLGPVSHTNEVAGGSVQGRQGWRFALDDGHRAVRHSGARASHAGTGAPSRCPKI